MTARVPPPGRVMLFWLTPLMVAFWVLELAFYLALVLFCLAAICVVPFLLAVAVFARLGFEVARAILRALR